MQIKIYALLVSILLLLSNSKQETSKLTDYEFSKGKYTLNGSNASGTIIGYYKDGSIKVKFSTLNGRINGEVITYHSNGQIETIRNYRLGKLFGSMEVFDNEGEKLAVLDIGLYSYGGGEEIKSMQIRKGKKLRDRGAGSLNFVFDREVQRPESETLHILEQLEFLITSEGETLLQVD